MTLMSNEKSIVNNEISLLAIIEVIFAIFIYWYIALYFNTYLHIVISIFLTPILLISSNESRKKGLELFNKWTELSDQDITLKVRLTMSMSTLLIITLFSYFSYKLFISSNGLEINTLLIYAFSSIMSGTFLIFFTSKRAERFDLLSRQFVSMHIGLILSSLLIGKIPLLTINLLIFVLLIVISRTPGLRIFTALILINTVTYTLGTLSRSLVSIVISVFFYFQQSFYEIANNWRRQTFVIDFHQFPEIIPDIEKSRIELLKLSYRVDQIKKDPIALIPFLIVFGPLFLISTIYRISIKSTFWFYIPFLFLTKTPDLNDSSKIGEFLSKLHETALANLRLILAIFVISVFIVTHFDFLNFQNGPSNFKTLVILFYIDFSSIEIWKLLQLGVACLTIIIYIYANHIGIPKRLYNIPHEKDFHVRSILILNMIRNWFSFFYFSFALFYLAYYFKIWEYDVVPMFFQNILNTLTIFISYRLF